MSLKAFVLNGLGAHVPEDQLMNITHPKFELQWFSTMKCMQIGAVLGYLYAMRVPAMRLFMGRKFQMSTTAATTGANLSRMDMTRSVLQNSRKGMMIGLIASVPGGMAYMYRNFSNDETLYTRAFQLRHNKKQINMDRGSLLLGLISGIYYKSMLGMPFSMGFAPGLAVGAIGVGLYNSFDSLYHRSEVKENVKERLQNYDKLPDKVQGQVENAKGSFRRVSQQAQERVEDAKGSMKKMAEDTKDAFKKASDEGKDSLKKASHKAQDYAHEFKQNANELKNKAKEAAQNEYKKIEHRAD